MATSGGNNDSCTSTQRRQWHPTPSTLAWKIPWVEEPGRLQSMGLLRVRHDWATSLWLFTFMHWRRKWQPTSVFLPGESQGRGSLVGCCLWGRTEMDMTEATAANFTLVYCAFPGNFPVTGLLTPFFLFVLRWKWYLSLWLSPSQGVTQFPQGISHVYTR